MFIGGGAASFFAALRCSQLAPDAKLAIVEKGKEFLQKVRISGGGRCNVTTVITDPRELASHYPRGSKALIGPFHKFTSSDTVKWFEQRGVKIKAEADGRMFPVSNHSADIMQALINGAEHAGITLLLSAGVTAINHKDDRWLITTRQRVLSCRQLFIGSGSSKDMWKMLEGLDIPVIPPVPSLFTFNIRHQLIDGLAGLSVSQAMINVVGSRLQASGPLLITHWGMSGPAILRLSAWGARELAALEYRFEILVNWAQAYDFKAFAEAKRQTAGREKVSAKGQLDIPLRLWSRLVLYSGISPEDRWADLNKKQLLALQENVTQCRFRVHGKSMFKEEFVTAGGVDLKAVDFKRFCSKQFPNLYWAGEILNIDGITGGFNFQAAWTGGWIAGTAMAGALNNHLKVIDQ